MSKEVTSEAMTSTDTVPKNQKLSSTLESLGLHSERDLELHLKQSVAIILAAGRGTRMCSTLPKVLHKVGGYPMIEHVLDTVKACQFRKTCVVVTDRENKVSSAIQKNYADVVIAEQPCPMGTADAVRNAEKALGCISDYESVIVLYADTPFTCSTHIKALARQRLSGADIVVSGFHTDTPRAYGRLHLNSAGNLEQIVENRDGSLPTDGRDHICNSGIMSINGSVLSELIQAVPPQSGTGEYYLTEIVNIASQKGIRCAFTIQEEATAMGVNSRQQLAEAERIFQQKKRQEILDIGVTLEDPSSVYFSYDTLIESDVVVEPHVYFGRGVHVKSGSRIRAFSHIENAQIGKQAVIGPFARIRDSALIGQEACIGNFVEVKNSVIGQGVKARHHTYLGDSDVGAGANIGAGTITCNYDGHTKHRTHIGRGAFVGSLTALVAPVSLGDNAYIGCGSVITENVPDNALAIRRVHHQSVKLNYVQKER